MRSGLDQSSLFRTLPSARLRPMSRPATTRGALYESALATNLRALIEYQSGGSTNGWCLRHKLPQSTINKVRNGVQSTTTAVLQEIEDQTGYAAWQLLHPDFNPAISPPMSDPRAMRVAAIFSALDGRDRAAIEALAETFATRAASHDLASPADAPAPTQPLGRRQ